MSPFGEARRRPGTASVGNNSSTMSHRCSLRYTQLNALRITLLPTLLYAPLHTIRDTARYTFITSAALVVLMTVACGTDAGQTKSGSLTATPTISPAPSSAPSTPSTPPASIPPPSGAPDSAEDALLLALIQGPDLAAIRAAVVEVGGTVTHDLPLINGVGASMTRSQLARVEAEVSSITRIIDDLAWEPEPELVIDDACTLRSRIQLEWQESRARWELYNKGDEPIALRRLNIEWPESLGELRGVSTETTEAREETGHGSGRKSQPLRGREKTGPSAALWAFKPELIINARASRVL